MTLLEKATNRLLFTYYSAHAALFSWTTVSHGGVAFRMRTRTSNEAHRALSFKTKEPETLAWIDRFQSASGEIVFYDLGANVGIYTLYAASRHPSMKIYSFEPEAQSFAALCANLAHNGLANAIPYQLAIADDEGLAELFVSSMSAGAGAAALGGAYPNTRLHGELPFKQGVYKSSLDALVTSYGLPSPTFIKIDVDGIEGRILSGGRTVLSDHRLRGLLVEFQFNELDELAPIIDLLSSCGLMLKVRSEWMAEFGTLHSQNFIFERQ